MKWIITVYRWVWWYEKMPLWEIIKMPSLSCIFVCRNRLSKMPVSVCLSLIASSLMTRTWWKSKFCSYWMEPRVSCNDNVYFTELFVHVAWSSFQGLLFPFLSLVFIFALLFCFCLFWFWFANITVPWHTLCF